MLILYFAIFLKLVICQIVPSTPEGEVDRNLQVTFTSNSARLCWSEDNVDPSCGANVGCTSGTLVCNGVFRSTIDKAKTIKVRTCSDSSLVSFNYRLKAPTITLSPDAGEYEVGRTVTGTISINADWGCMSDSGTPACSFSSSGCSSGTKTSTLTLSSPVTISGIACRGGDSVSSSVVSIAYKIKAALNPIFSPGWVQESNVVSLSSANAAYLCVQTSGTPSCNNNGCDNGVTSSPNPAQYTITQNTTLRVIGCSPGGSSTVSEYSYSIFPADTPAPNRIDWHYPAPTVFTLSSMYSSKMCWSRLGKPDCNCDQNKLDYKLLPSSTDFPADSLLSNTNYYSAIGCSAGGPSWVSSVFLTIDAAELPVLDPSTGEIRSTASIKLSSKNASYICYSWDSCPACNIALGGCSVGVKLGLTNYQGIIQGPVNLGKYQLRARGCSIGGNSDVAWTAYNVTETPAALPTFSSSGAVDCNTVVTIQSTGSRFICYTTILNFIPLCGLSDCLLGTKGSQVKIENGISVIHARGCSWGGNSEVAHSFYTTNSPKQPVFTPGNIANNGLVTITSTYARFICYTTDGTNPQCGTSTCTLGLQLNGKVASLQLTASTTIRARGCSAGGFSSVNVASYTIFPPGVPSFSPAGGVVKVGSTITMTSTYSTHICSTIGTDQNPPAIPVCAANRACTTGTAGLTFTISSAYTTVHARGCVSTVSSPVQLAYFIAAPAKRPVYSQSDIGCGGTITVSSENARHICYTTDVSTPQCAAEACTKGTAVLGTTASITASSTSLSVFTVRAIGCSVGGNSVVEDKNYTLVAAQTVTSGDTITLRYLSTPTLQSNYACRICYTRDETNPSCETNTGICSTNPSVLVNGTVIVKFQACSSASSLHSSVTTVTYKVAAAQTPTIIIPDVRVCRGAAIINSENSQAICYSLGSTDPACNSSKTGCSSGTLYTSTGVPVFNVSVTIKAIGCSIGGDSSVTTSDQYTPTAASSLATVIDPGLVQYGTPITFTATSYCRICASSQQTPVCSYDSTGDCLVGSSSIPIITNTTIKAVACSVGGDTSIGTYTYSVQAAQTPTFSPSSPVACNSQVSIASTYSRSVCYTIDGTNPQCSNTSTCTTGTAGNSVTISTNGTIIKAMGCVVGGLHSQIATSDPYVLSAVQDPTFSLDSSTVETGTTVTITSMNECRICVTTNGLAPECSSTGCSVGTPTSSLTITSPMCVKAIACSGSGNSRIIDRVYEIEPAWMPKFTEGYIAENAKLSLTSAASCYACTGSQSVTCGAGCATSVGNTIAGYENYGLACTFLETSDLTVYSYKVSTPNTPTFSPSLAPSVTRISILQPITISSIDASYICYTTDESDPTCSSSSTCSVGTFLTGSSGSFSLNANVTIVKAVGCAQQLSSQIAQTQYWIAVPTTPIFSPSPQVVAVNTIAVVTAINASKICYTTNDNMPDCSGTCSPSPLSLPITQTPITYRAIACAGNIYWSIIANATYTVSPAITPTFSIAAGAVSYGTTVTLTSVNSSRICYTTNGDTPQCSANACDTGTVYTNPISLLQAQTINARGCSIGGQSSVAAAAYTILSAVEPLFTSGAALPVSGVVVTSTYARHICYSTDGTAPECGATTCNRGQIINGPFGVVSVKTTTGLRAIGCSIGGNSLVTRAGYTVAAPGTPAFDPAVMDYVLYGSSVKLVNTNPWTTSFICFTTNSDDPVCSGSGCSSGTVYSTPIRITSWSFIKARGCGDGGSSRIISATYIPSPAARPRFSVGYATEGTTITIRSTNSDFMCYTINGTDPMCDTLTCSNGNYVAGSSSTLPYTIDINVKVIGCSVWGNSDVSEYVYTTVPPDTPTFTLVPASYPYSTILRWSSRNATKVCTSQSLTSLPSCANNGVCTTLTSLTLTAHTTIYAVACNSRFSSQIVAYPYIVAPAIKPTFALANGTTIDMNTVFVSAASINASHICYSFQGCPVCSTSGCASGNPILVNSANSYSAQIPIGGSGSVRTLQVQGCSPGGHSEVASASYIILPAQIPVFSVTKTVIPCRTQVTITSANSEFVCYLTSNSAANLPSCGDSTCIQGTKGNTLSITTDVFVHAIGCSRGGNSAVVHKLYILDNPAIPVFTYGALGVTQSVAVTSTDSSHMCISRNSSAPPSCNSNGCSSGTLISTATIPFSSGAPILVQGCSVGGHSYIAQVGYNALASSLPTFSPTAGAVQAGTSVTITSQRSRFICVNSGTTTVADPVCSGDTCSVGSVYTSLTLTAGITYKAIGCSSDGWHSPISTATYTILPASRPTFSSSYLVTCLTSVTVASLNAQRICYTTDGTTTPACSATTCTAGNIISSSTGTIVVNAYMKVLAIGCSVGGDSPLSPMEYYIYNATKPVLPTYTDNLVDNGFSIVATSTSYCSICYTADGTVPDCSSNCLSKVTITKSTTVRARACSSGPKGCGYGSHSDFAEATYNVGPAQTPVIQPTPISCVSPLIISSVRSEFICYTTDGTDPACGTDACSGTSQRYSSSSFQLSAAVTVKAIGCSKFGSSSIQSTSISLSTAVAPTASPTAQPVVINTPVSLSSTSFCRICYTTDLTLPACNNTACTVGSQYSSPIIISRDLTINALACSLGGNLPSGALPYTIKAAEKPVFSPSTPVACATPITITSTNSAFICYSITATDPVCGTTTCTTGTLYTSTSMPSIVSMATTIKAIGCVVAGKHSEIASQAYDVSVANTPNFTPDSDTISAKTSIKISAVGACGLCISTDGTGPQCSSSTTCLTGNYYSGTTATIPNIITQTCVKAQACSSGGHSNVSDHTYTIKPASLPIFTAGGVVVNSQVTIESPNACYVCITDDGSNPMCSSNTCAASRLTTYQITQPTLVKAIGCSPDSSSGINAYGYNVFPADPVVFTPDRPIGCTTKIKLTSLNSNRICYSRGDDIVACGTDRCVSGSAFLTDIDLLGSSSKINAQGCSPGGHSPVSSASYTLPSASFPAFTIGGVPYGSRILSTSTDAEYMCYSTDGKVPVCGDNGASASCLTGTKLSTITATADTSLWVRGCAYGGNSEVNYAQYTILPPQVPAFTHNFPGPYLISWETTITMTSAFSTHICYFASWLDDVTTLGDPVCGQTISTCTSGTQGNSFLVSSIANPSLANNDLVVKAKGCLPGGRSSALAETIYRIPIPELPVVSKTVDINCGESVTITSKYAQSICYTTNGAVPVCGSTTNQVCVQSSSTPLTITDFTTINAIGCSAFGFSGVLHTDLTLNPASTIQYSYAYPSFPYGTSVTISVTSACKLCVTTDGTVPDCSSSSCASAKTKSITLAGATIVRSLACSPAGNMAMSYNYYCVAPAQDPTYFIPTTTCTKLVSVSSANSTSMCYTTDGSTPRCSSTLNTCSSGTSISGPTNTISISSNTTLLMVQGCSPGGNSKVTNTSVLFGIPATPTTNPDVDANQDYVFPYATAATISSINSCRICYTTDNSNPSCTSTGCGGTSTAFTSLSITTGSTTVKAIGCSPGGASDVKTWTYKLVKALTPTVAVVGSCKTLTISSTYSRSICYSLDGRDPQCDGSVGICVTAPSGSISAFQLNATTYNLKARGCLITNYHSDVLTSNLNYASYTADDVPTFSIDSGEYQAGTSLSIQATCRMCYTSDGTDPVCGAVSGCTSGTSGPLTTQLFTSICFKARSCSVFGNSDVVSKVYMIRAAKFPVFSSSWVPQGRTITVTSTNACTVCAKELSDTDEGQSLNPICDGTCTTNQLTFTINRDIKFKAQGCTPGGNSLLDSYGYSILPPSPPSFNPPIGPLPTIGNIRVDSSYSTYICYSFDSQDLRAECDINNQRCNRGTKLNPLVDGSYTIQFDLSDTMDNKYLTAVGCNSYTTSNTSLSMYYPSPAIRPTFVPQLSLKPARFVVGSVNSTFICLSTSSCVTPQCPDVGSTYSAVCVMGDKVHTNDQLILTSSVIYAQGCSPTGNSPLNNIVINLPIPDLPLLSTGVLLNRTFVTISSTNADHICYTDSGLTPKCNPLTCDVGNLIIGSNGVINSTTPGLIRAQGCSYGGNSIVAQVSYATRTVPAPYSTLSGALLSGTPVTLLTTDPVNVLHICYTDQAVIPLCAPDGCLQSSKFTLPIVITRPTTIRARACTLYHHSDLSIFSYSVLPAERPQFITATYVAEGQRVSVGSANAVSLCYYAYTSAYLRFPDTYDFPQCGAGTCTKGTTVNGNSMQYTIISNFTTLLVQGCSPGGNSPVNNYTYQIMPPDTPTFNPRPSNYWPNRLVGWESVNATSTCTSFDSRVPDCSACSFYGRSDTGTSGTYFLNTSVVITTVGCSARGASIPFAAPYIVRPANPPTFSRASSTLTCSTIIIITPDNNGTHGCYTTDSSEPKCNIGGTCGNGNVVTLAGVSLTTKSVNISARSCSPAGDSDVRWSNYSVLASTSSPPTPTAATYPVNTIVNLNTANACWVCYILGSTDPACSDSGCSSGTAAPPYVTLTEKNTELRYLGCSPGGNSDIQRASYVVAPAVIPTFSLTSSTYAYLTSVTISSKNASHICFSDSGTPQCDSSNGGCIDSTHKRTTSFVYNLVKTGDLKAIGCSKGGDSDVATITYTIALPAIPVPSIANGSSLVCGSNIRFTAINSSHLCVTYGNTDPECLTSLACQTGDLVTDPMVLTQSTMRVRACSPAGSSAVYYAYYNIYSADLPYWTAGSVPSGSSISLSSVNASHQCYSTDGSTVPVCTVDTCTSGTKADPSATISITTNTVVLTQGCSPGGHSSINRAAYTIAPPGVPSFSPIGDIVDFGTTVNFNAVNHRHICFNSVAIDAIVQTTDLPVCTSTGCSVGTVATSTSIRSHSILLARSCVDSRSSQVARAYYFVRPANPIVFSPVTGQVSCGSQITITSDYAQKVCYTIDNTAPSCTASSSVTCVDGTKATLVANQIYSIYAIGCSVGGNTDIAHSDYITNMPSDPTFSYGWMMFPYNTQLKISATSACQICTTTDGSDPVCGASTCSSGTVSMSLTKPTSIRAVACSPTGQSNTILATYTCIAPADTPVITPPSQNGACAADFNVYSGNATSICYSTNGVAPVCGTSLNTCTTGTNIVGSNVNIRASAKTTTLMAQGCSPGGNSVVTTYNNFVLNAATSPQLSGTSPMMYGSSVVLTSTASCQICHTTDGTTVPACSTTSNSACATGTVFAPFSLTKDVTIKALACSIGGNSAVETINVKLAAAKDPTFTYPSVLSCNNTVKISSENAVFICYTTTDGQTPQCSNTLTCTTGTKGDTVPLTSATTTIKAQGCVIDTYHSTVATSSTQTLDAATSLTFSPTAIEVRYGYPVVISSEKACRICVTTDNSVPTCSATSCNNGSPYLGNMATIIVTRAVSISALACSAGGNTGVITNNYTISPARTPVHSSGSVALNTVVVVSSNNACRMCHTTNNAAPQCGTNYNDDCSQGTLTRSNTAISTVTSSVTLRAQGCSQGKHSTIDTYSYDVITPDTPLFSPEMGFAAHSSSITVSSTNATYLCISTDLLTVPSCGSGAGKTCQLGEYRDGSQTVVDLKFEYTPHILAVGCALTSSAPALRMYRYYPAALPVLPAGPSFVANSVIRMTSTYSSHLCYSTLPCIDPVCTDDDCLIGTKSYTLTLSARTTYVAARGCSLGGNSDVASMTYNIYPAEEPLFTSGFLTSFPSSTVMVSSNNAAYMCITTDRSAPLCNNNGQCQTGTRYPPFLPLSLSGNTIARAQGCSAGGSSSITSLPYIAITPAVPAFSPLAGYVPYGTQVQIVNMRYDVPNTYYYCYTTSALLSDPDPVCSSTCNKYTQPITVVSTLYIKARTCIDGGVGSAVSVGWFIIRPAELPMSSVAVNEVACNTPFVIISQYAQRICYRIGTTDPTCTDTGCATGDTTSTGYMANLTLSSEVTVKARGCSAGGNSQVATFNYVFNIVKPVFLPGNTDITYNQAISITSLRACSICVSTTSADPVCGASSCIPTYSFGALITQNTDYKAVGCGPNNKATDIVSQSYKIQAVTAPIFKPPGNPTSVIASGRFVFAYSEYASHICLTSDNTDPVCTTNGCSGTAVYNKGKYAHFRLSSSATLKAAACGLTSATGTTSYFADTCIGGAYDPIYSVVGPAVDYQQTVTITGYADYSGLDHFLCTTTGDTDPVCGATSDTSCQVGTTSANTSFVVTGVIKQNTRACSRSGHSPVISRWYWLIQAAPPVFTPVAGNVVIGSIASWSSSLSTHVCVSDDENNKPACADSVGSCLSGTPMTQMPLLSSETIYVQGCRRGNHSTVVSAKYVVVAAPPVFSPLPTIPLNPGDAVRITSPMALFMCISDSVTPACGTTDCSAGTKYDGELANINVNAPATLRAIGCVAGGPSTVTTASYSMVALAPVFTPASGRVALSSSVTVTSTYSKHICVTYDGSTPECTLDGCSSGAITSNFVISKAVSVMARGCSSLGVAGRSPTSSTSFNILAGAVTFNPVAGGIAASTSVSMSSLGSDFICYTTAVANPSCGDGVCTTGLKGNSVTITAGSTVKAIGCVASPSSPSDVASATYVIRPGAVVFSPVAGAVSSGASVSMTSANSQFICYSDTATAPVCGTSTCTSGTSGSQVTISAAKTITAIGCSSDQTVSGPSSSAAYTISGNTTPLPVLPVFTPAAGQIDKGTSIKVDSTNAVLICYTLDGTNPTCTQTSNCQNGASVTVGPINTALTLKSIGCNSGGASSVATAAYTLKMAVAPTFNPIGGIIDNNTDVTLTSAGASFICYTTDSSDPVCGSSTCTVGKSGSTIRITAAVSIKARACSSTLQPSDIVNQIYTIKGVNAAGPPVFSLASGTYDVGTSITINSSLASFICITVTSTPPVCGNTACNNGRLSVGNTTVVTINSTYFGIVRAVGCFNGTSSPVTASTYKIPNSDAAAPTPSLPTMSTVTVNSPVVITTSKALWTCLTKDGTDPSCSDLGCNTGAQTTGSTATVSIDQDMIIKASGCSPGGNSPISRFVYLVTGSLPASLPTFSPAGPEVNKDTTVVISSTNAKWMCGSTSGTAAACADNGCLSGTSYTGSSFNLVVSVATTISAMGCSVNKNSAEAKVAFTIKGAPLTPTFSPVAGAVASQTNVIVTSSGATTLCYTTVDTVTPACGGASCSSGTSTSSNSASVMINSAVTIRAVGCSAGGSSPMGTSSYTVKLNAPSLPLFLPGSGALDSPTVVTVSSIGATKICISTDSTTPSCSTCVGINSATGGVNITQATTVKVIGCNAAGSSDVATATYTIKSSQTAGAPVFSPAAGTYTDSTTVSIKSDNSIYMCYTIDKSTPACSATSCSAGAVGTQPLIYNVNKTLTLSVVGCPGGPVGTADYTIQAKKSNAVMASFNLASILLILSSFVLLI